eukprot:7825362-Karenia_brevis.AAC.1
MGTIRNVICSPGGPKKLTIADANPPAWWDRIGTYGNHSHEHDPVRRKRSRGFANCRLLDVELSLSSLFPHM